MLNFLKGGTGRAVQVQKQEKSLFSGTQQSLLERWNYLEAYNRGRCFPADAEKEVPGKPKNAHLSKTLLDKLLRFSFLGGHFWEVEEERKMKESMGVISKQSNLPSKTQ